eukprot:CAMPEP_0168168934 /NCGR_PEP_ID=MMETSP0139_2-20121125/3373_1 /TAXON_ID=44445 /ORGANISM="Pseudo-nitzschia australis, Strain 10249 10 AB" /LENGTH=517 /DNA_ID=CAMNT_0008086327 /DNA_START=379 /DNA_END=1932 /DNA_ORIENTATION=-
MAFADADGPPPGNPGDPSLHTSSKIDTNADHPTLGAVPGPQANRSKNRGENAVSMDNIYIDDAMAGLMDSNAVDFTDKCNNANNGQIIADAKQTESHNDDTMDDNDADNKFHNAALMADANADDNDDGATNNIFPMATDTIADDDVTASAYTVATSTGNKEYLNAIRGETIVLDANAANDADTNARISKNKDVDDPIDAFHLFLTHNPNISADAIQSVLTSRKSTTFRTPKPKQVPENKNTVVANMEVVEANALIEIRISKPTPTQKTDKNNVANGNAAMEMDDAVKASTATTKPKPRRLKSTLVISQTDKHQHLVSRLGSAQQDVDVKMDVDDDNIDKYETMETTRTVADNNKSKRFPSLKKTLATINNYLSASLNNSSLQKAAKTKTAINPQIPVFATTVNKNDTKGWQISVPKRRKPKLPVPNKAKIRNASSNTNIPVNHDKTTVTNAHAADVEMQDRDSPAKQTHSANAKNSADVDSRSVTSTTTTNDRIAKMSIHSDISNTTKLLIYSSITC